VLSISSLEPRVDKPEQLARRQRPIVADQHLPERRWFWPRRLSSCGPSQPRLATLPAIVGEPFQRGANVLVIVRLARRELVWINVTAYPTAEWIARQITEAFPRNEAPRYLIRDRDGIFGVAVTRRLRAMGIRDKIRCHRSMPSFSAGPDTGRNRLAGSDL
jgi:hypothetical protein